MGGRGEEKKKEGIFIKTKIKSNKNTVTPIMQGANPRDIQTGRDEVREKLKEHLIKHLQGED